uniref:DUF4794 domain-containing protein n=1 Tax=Clastoptera arizonana TaxID=38151 RepID=A0A1B6C3Y0_9HEMI
MMSAGNTVLVPGEMWLHILLTIYTFAALEAQDYIPRFRDGPIIPVPSESMFGGSSSGGSSYTYSSSSGGAGQKYVETITVNGKTYVREGKGGGPLLEPSMLVVSLPVLVWYYR